MVSTALNFFQLTTPTVTASAPALTSTVGESSDALASNTHFSQLIAENTANDRVSARRNASSDNSVSSSASTTPRDHSIHAVDHGSDDDSDETTHALNHEVTPHEASDALKTLDSDTSMDEGTKDQLKTQLQQIVASGTPKSVSDILTAVAGEPDTANAAATAAAQNVFNLLVQNGQAQQESLSQATTTQASTVLNPALLSLQAVTFRPDSATDKSDEDAKTKDSDDDQTAATVVQVTPLAQQLIIPQTGAPAITNDNTTTTAASEDAITINDNTPQPSIDTLIPPLTTPGQKAALPAVTLPAGATTPSSAAPIDSSAAFQQQLQAVSGNQQIINAVGKTDAASPDALKTIDSKTTATSISTDTSAINPTGAATAPQSASAVTAISNSAAVTSASIKDQVFVAVRQASRDGINDITIQMSPGDLGRVEVKMHTDATGQTSIAFTADKPETFDALSRNAASLERSLQDTGIKADTSSMQFNLRQQPQPQSNLNGDGQNRQSQPQANLTGQTSSSDTAVAAATPTITRIYRLNVTEGVDIHA